ncbi:MAG: hypothetical protein QOK06_3005 [Acidimicrobiaceae bacterium]
MTARADMQDPGHPPSVRSVSSPLRALSALRPTRSSALAAGVTVASPIAAAATTARDPLRLHASASCSRMSAGTAAEPATSCVIASTSAIEILEMVVLREAPRARTLRVEATVELSPITQKRCKARA